MDKHKFRDCRDCESKVHEIIDWINAHDEYRVISLICAKCKNKCKDMSDTNAETCTAFEPSIEQELESGLKECEYSGEGNCCVCTRIFLPAAKYREYIGDRENYTPFFQKIPVFSYSGDEIIYCTD